ncbi:MAG TPA: HemK/PrmC family methyltransferase [Acidimicrobiales bacterium]|nr:HemK/PrmC family methyltransferase [Acidimicrobiales bacterium]
MGPSRLVEILASAGCVAPDEEAAELIRAARDPDHLASMVERRTRGEPLAWITGEIVFAGNRVTIAPGVYVPRQQTELLVGVALGFLGHQGCAVDLCTGSGAVAVALAAARPAARVLAVDVDPAAWACACANGIDAHCGDLDAALPAGLTGAVDLVTAVPPYVPSDQLQYLPRDVLAYEPVGALDGGPAGTAVLERVVAAAARLLRPGGHLVVEMGGDQHSALAPVLARAGFSDMQAHHDEDGDLRVLSVRYGGSARRRSSRH